MQYSAEPTLGEHEASSVTAACKITVAAGNPAGETTAFIREDTCESALADVNDSSLRPVDEVRLISD